MPAKTNSVNGLRDLRQVTGFLREFSPPWPGRGNVRKQTSIKLAKVPPTPLKLDVHTTVLQLRAAVFELEESLGRARAVLKRFESLDK